MSKTDKVLKIAGKNAAGLVKGISVTNGGEINVSSGAKVQYTRSGALEAGKVASFYSEIGTNSRIFIIVNNTYTTPYKVDGFVYYIHADSSLEHPLPDNRILLSGVTTPELVVQSDGNKELVSGNGTRSLAYTNLTPSIASAVRFALTNTSSSSNLEYIVAVVSYPNEQRVAKAEAPTQVAKQYDYIPETVNNSIIIPASDSTAVVLYETNTYTTIEYLEFTARDLEQPALYISPKSKDGSVLSPIGQGNIATGTGRASTIGVILNEGNSLLDITESTTQGVRVTLNRYMTFPHGVRITVANYGDNPREVRCNLRAYAIKKMVTDYAE